MKYIKVYIADNLDIKYNTLINEYEWNGQPLTDADYNTIYIRIGVAFKKANKKVKYNIPKQLVFDIIHSDFTDKYNPLADFLEVNQGKNCNGAISELAATIKTSTEFTEKHTAPFVEFYLTRWLVNMIATALYGTDNPLIIALLGKQGTGKTEFWRRLLPSQLQRYFGEFAIADDKDFFIAMTKHMIIADDELSGKSKIETKALKKITSMQNIYVRRPYGRVQETIKRRSSFCGGGNDLKVLYDLTGNRRIVPIEVLSINYKAYNSINKIDLLVEAYQLLVTGFNYRLTGEDVQALNDASSDFEFNELEVELCQEFLKKADSDRVVEKRTASDIKNLFETNLKHRVNLVKLGKALTALEFEKHSDKVHKKVIQRYRLHPDSKIFSIENDIILANVGSRSN